MKNQRPDPAAPKPPTLDEILELKARATNIVQSLLMYGEAHPSLVAECWRHFPESLWIARWYAEGQIPLTHNTVERINALHGFLAAEKLARNLY